MFIAANETPIHVSIMNMNESSIVSSSQQFVSDRVDFPLFLILILNPPSEAEQLYFCVQ